MVSADYPQTHFKLSVAPLSQIRWWIASVILFELWRFFTYDYLLHYLYAALDKSMNEGIHVNV